MGKHKKVLRSEKAKVKLRSKKEKDKLLPKGLNITDASFKSKKIILQEQLKVSDDSLILSKRKLDVKALLKRLEHHNTKSRLESLKELKEMLTLYDPENIVLTLQPLLRGILSLTLDIEKVVRREAVKVLHLILSQIPTEKFSYSNIIIPYLGCTMTHINPNVREDSLLLLETIANNCSQVIVENYSKIIPNLMDLISQFHSDTSRRMLSSKLNGRMTNVKWTTIILSSLANIFDVIVSSENTTHSDTACSDIYIENTNTYKPIYINKILIMPYSVKFNTDDFKENKFEQLPLLFNHIDQLLPLISDSWIEITSENKSDKNILNNNEIDLLQNIIKIFQSIIKYINILEKKDKAALEETNFCKVFKTKFQQYFYTKIFDCLPYYKQIVSDKNTGKKKYQEDFTGVVISDCDEQNLALFNIYAWFTKIKINENKQFNNISKSVSKKLIEYIHDKVKKWSKLNNLSNLQLINVLNIVFLQTSEFWCNNNLSLEPILQAALQVYLQTENPEIKHNIFTLFKNIAMDHTLSKLHSFETFKQFIESLLPILMSNSIHENVIQLLNTIVLRRLEWIRGYLTQNKEAIIENAKSIDVVGSKNVQESKLMICNLFYFTDEMIYF